MLQKLFPPIPHMKDPITDNLQSGKLVRRPLLGVTLGRGGHSPAGAAGCLRVGPGGRQGTLRG